ncbi:hypothetical protein GF108_05945 [Phyllobacterium sp. SYP-B3895]|uniref:class I SAM-dependent methyltransferase n=1 Tax=Phyllobacterium sp. SYP-B3895 TaxID=2663240 RepID=UPI001299976D|nr:class I SAM-dependent methyltransferase [Phyllobacterium sp. SYP-B3895]MRG55124.1 hypothetical protein [Phyllobacterium sp. SYP-B3895]
MSVELRKERQISVVDKYRGALDCVSPASFWTVDNLVRESAWKEHAPFAYWLVESQEPRTFVELGTHGGFSYFAFCQAIKKLALETKCYAIDTWRGDEHSGLYDDDVHDSVKSYNDAHYSGFSNLIRMTFEEARHQFADGSVDLLHIDGRHFYDDVKSDFETWLPKLSERAIVLFHDTEVRERGFGVFKLWEEIRDLYPSFEFQHGHGLGVLAVGPKIPKAVAPLFEASNSHETVVAIRSAYARLGSTISLEAKDATQQDELSRMTAENDALGKALGESREQVQGLVSNAAALERTIEQLQLDRARQDGELRELRNSTSWKLTAPLRFVGRLIGRG